MMTKKYTVVRFQKEKIDELSQHLQSILINNWLFGSLPGIVISDLSHQFTGRSYNKNQYVFHQGDKSQYIYVIVDGEVSIETINVDGKVTKISRLNPGDIFGEFAVIDEGMRSANALVVRSSLVASLKSETFLSLMESYPVFSKKIMTVLVARLRTTNQQLESLVTMNLLQRTAKILLQISSVEGPEIKVTQTELAERLYASREKVNSKLKDLEAMGAVKRGRGVILVENADRLLTLIGSFEN